MEQVLDGLFSLAGAVVTGFVTLLVAGVAGLFALFKYVQEYRFSQKRPFLEHQFQVLKQFTAVCSSIGSVDEAGWSEAVRQFRIMKNGEARLVSGEALNDLTDQLDATIADSYATNLERRPKQRALAIEISDKIAQIVQSNWNVSNGYVAD